MPSGVTVTKTYAYDSLGRRTSETLKRRAGPASATQIDLTTRYEYDALDRITKITDPLGNESIQNFDANGQLWKVTHRYKKSDGTYDVRDVVTRSFDAADRVLTETDAGGNVKSYSYDEAGNVIAVLDAEGHTTRFEYDAMNRRTAVIDATGYRTETVYNLRGDVIGVVNANGEKTAFEFDALGRRTATVDAKGFRTETLYDANGNPTCVIDANAQAGLQPKNAYGCTQYRVYDELDRVTRIVDALGGETSFAYDFLGGRLSVKDAEAKTWRFAYDDLGRLVGETDHKGKAIAYKPDEAGNVYEKTNRLGEVTRSTFDAGNRLTRVDYLADGSAETFGYDAAGNRNAVANGAVSYTLQYDTLNRLTRKADSRGRALSFTYDRVGNILTKTPYQGSKTSYVYNAANRLVMLQNPDYTQVDYQYDPAGRLLSRVTANGARLTQTFDANGWVTRLSQYDAANARISQTSYTRDRVGNITGRTDASGATSYTLDALYRLTSADYPGGADDELFTYDKVGNRKTYTKGALTANADTRYYNYASGSHRLAEIRIGSTSGVLESKFAHDFEGRLTSQTGVGAKTLAWDAKGRVKSVGAETYVYDPLDYRIGRSGGTLGTRDYFLEGEHLESEYSGSALKAKYFRGSSTDELVAAWLTDTDGKLKPYLYHHDPVNSVTALSGHNGRTGQSLKYTAFGGVQSATGASPSRLKYTGREDDGAGLYYYRARYYDPAIGRFISEDPLGFDAGDVDFYAYVGNNPVNANDPAGNCPWCIGALIGGGIDLGLQLISNGGNFSTINYTNIGVSAALGAVGNIAGGRAAGAFLNNASRSTKEIIGELGAGIKGLGQGRIPVGLQQKIYLSKSFTRVDQIKQNVLTGEKVLVESKYSTSGYPRLSDPQKLAKVELPARGIDYRVVITTPERKLSIQQAL
nr:RHS repeat domain-containing protein [Methylosinus sp. Sm6]